MARSATTLVFSTLLMASPALLRTQLPKLMELVGLTYSAWFTYRYLLFKVHAAKWDMGKTPSPRLYTSALP
jgi:hypothetical protein